MTTPTIVTDGKLAETKNPIANAIKQLSGQVERAKIVDEDTNAAGGDLYKIINNQLKKNDEARTALVKPLNEHVKWINAQFKPNTEALEGLKLTLKSKLDKYAEEKQAELDRIAEEQRKAAEEEALARAEAAQADGDTELAETIVDEAASVEHKKQTQISRGNFGSATSTRTDWKAECIDVKALCLAIANGDLPESFITVNQAELNKLAVSKKIEKTNFGIKIYKKVSASVR